MLWNYYKIIPSAAFLAVAMTTLACEGPQPPGPYDAGVATIDSATADNATVDTAAHLDGTGGDAHGIDVVVTDGGAADGGAADGGAVADVPSPDVVAVDGDGPADADAVDAVDAGSADTTVADGGPIDTSGSDGPDTGGVNGIDAADSSTPDAGAVDTVALDAGEPDSGAPDSGAPDSGAPDSGAPDSGAPDSGAPDSGAPDSGPTDAGPALPPGLGASPCKLPGELPVAGAIELVDAFPKLSKTFGSLTFLTHPHDGTDRIVVVERKGVVWAFNNDPNVSQKSKVLDISAKVAVLGEGGLLSVAFHPKFASNGRLFLSYTSTIYGGFSSVFSEIQVDPKTLVAKVPTEKVLLVIKQPFSNHDGGQILFDQTGKLIIGMGDGGSGGDPLNSGQSPKTLLGAVLRIDVDNVPAGKKYGIPSDNPKKAGWAPELWAMGLRNPWRMSVDRKTGVLIAGDVGQNKWEEVTLVPKGGNLGWRHLEGSHCYNPVNCNKTGVVMPIFEYAHNVGYAITGGYVYRGASYPSLQGMYIFGDYVSRRYWGLAQEGAVWKATVLIASAAMSPSSFGEDEAGEIYVVTLTGAQKIARIQPKKSSIVGPQAPAKLSQTGCFSDLKKLLPAKGVVPYDVNAPLWSDGAAKVRFVVPAKADSGVGPAPATLPKDANAAVNFPLGTILIKHFGLGSGAPGTADNTPVETRFMVKGKAGWVFWTYTWNAQGTDATLKLDGGDTAYTLPKSFKTQTWRQPSSADCLTCHSGGQGAVPLGLTTAQLNRTYAYGPGNVLNQLQVWSDGGLLSNKVAASAALPALPAQPWPKLSSLTAAQRSAHARAWLAVNCASCHPGSSPAAIDLRFSTPLNATKTCNVTPGFGTNGGGFAKLLSPGSPSASVLYTRLTAAPGSDWFMPHLGVTIADTAGIALIKAWIQGLSSCN